MKRKLLLLPVLLWGCGTDVSGPAGALLTCVYGEGAGLAPAEVLQLVGAESQALCISPAGTAASEFVYIPFFGTAAPEDDEDPVRLSLELELSGSWSASSASSASFGSSSTARRDGPLLMRGENGAGSDDHRRESATADPTFHDWLRHKEISELTPRIRGGAASATATAADVPNVGELMELNVSIDCSTEDLRSGRVLRVSDHAILVADTANPANLLPSDYQHMALTFDTLIHRVATAHFGAPQDIDENGRTIFFFTRAVNELTSRGARTVTLGFFWSGDLFPEEATPRLEACPAANQAEIMYLIAPDPFGTVGPPISRDQLLNRSIPLIAHEFQHLVNASRRLFVNQAMSFEEPWLNEGLSHIAEELLFYAVSGLEPGSNLSAADLDDAGAIPAFNRYMGGNLGNFSDYLTEPDTASLMGIDLLSTRGATWSFLRYAADRTGRGDEAFFKDVVNGQRSGLENLDRVIAPDGALSWMQDWSVSVYADDLVAGIAERYTQPSWNLRSIYGRTELGEYPLRVLSLSPTDALQVELLPGGSAYAAFGTAAGEQAVLSVQVEGAPERAAVRGSLVRVR